LLKEREHNPINCDSEGDVTQIIENVSSDSDELSLTFNFLIDRNVLMQIVNIFTCFFSMLYTYVLY
jgi:hypothetical protein